MKVSPLISNTQLKEVVFHPRGNSSHKELKYHQVTVSASGASLTRLVGASPYPCAPPFLR